MNENSACPMVKGCKCVAVKSHLWDWLYLDVYIRHTYSLSHPSWAPTLYRPTILGNQSLRENMPHWFTTSCLIFRLHLGFLPLNFCFTDLYSNHNGKWGPWYQCWDLTYLHRTKQKHLWTCWVMRPINFANHCPIWLPQKRSWAHSWSRDVPLNAIRVWLRRPFLSIY